MKITLKIDKQSQAETRRLLAEFERLTGKGTERGIEEVAMSVGRRLAHTVQPYGTNDAKGDAFIRSIGYQVDRAWFGTNLGAFPHNTSMRSAHYAARKNGVVPERLFRKEQGKPWLGLISEPERDRYKKTAQDKAGRAKAAWVEAANKIGAGRLSDIAKWIQRHVGSGYGGVQKSGKGLKYRVELENRTPYLRKIQPPRAIKAAVQVGFQNGYKRLQIIINAELKKLKQ